MGKRERRKKNLVNFATAGEEVICLFDMTHEVKRERRKGREEEKREREEKEEKEREEEREREREERERERERKERESSETQRQKTQIRRGTTKNRVVLLFFLA